MLGLSPKDAWLATLILISIAAFGATALWSGRLSDGRAIAYSVGFSLAFTLLAVATGLAVLR